MTDLVAKLTAALDAEEARLRALSPGWSSGSILDEAIVESEARELRMVAAHRKILDLHAGTVEVRDIAWDKFRAGEMPTKAESTHATHAERELAALQVVLEALAEAYGIEA